MKGLALYAEGVKSGAIERGPAVIVCGLEVKLAFMKTPIFRFFLELPSALLVSAIQLSLACLNCQPSTGHPARADRHCPVW